jgi:hypothetical protein
MINYKKIFFADMAVFYLIFSSVPFMALAFTPIVAACCGYRYAFYYDLISFPLFFLKSPNQLLLVSTFAMSWFPDWFRPFYVIGMVFMTVPAALTTSFVANLIGKRWIRPLIKGRVRVHI